ncbi:MAG: low molecular weight protein-tyrosine-phosphatase [Paludibacteraceae bacterium]
MQDDNSKISILFICLGNICRSPMAETVFNKILEKNDCSSEFKIDSAGLLDYHEGEKADPRMRSHAEKRGYNVTHRSRPITKKDLVEFDYIIGMDDQNIRQLLRLAKTPDIQSKIHKMTLYNRDIKADNVPDPYYGGDKGFEYVIDLLEDACKGLFDYVKNRPSRW